MWVGSAWGMCSGMQQHLMGLDPDINMTAASLVTAPPPTLGATVGVGNFLSLGRWDLVAARGQPLFQANWPGDWIVGLLTDRHGAKLADGDHLWGVASGVTSLWTPMVLSQKEPIGGLMLLVPLLKFSLSNFNQVSPKHSQDRLSHQCHRLRLYSLLLCCLGGGCCTVGHTGNVIISDPDLESRSRVTSVHQDNPPHACSRCSAGGRNVFPTRWLLTSAFLAPPTLHGQSFACHKMKHCRFGGKFLRGINSYCLIYKDLSSSVDADFACPVIIHLNPASSLSSCQPECSLFSQKMIINYVYYHK